MFNFLVIAHAKMRQRGEGISMFQRAVEIAIVVGKLETVDVRISKFGFHVFQHLLAEFLVGFLVGFPITLEFPLGFARLRNQEGIIVRRAWKMPTHGANDVLMDVGSLVLHVVGDNRRGSISANTITVAIDSFCLTKEQLFDGFLGWNKSLWESDNKAGA